MCTDETKQLGMLIDRQRELEEALKAMLIAFANPLTRRALGGHDERQMIAVMNSRQALQEKNDA